MTVLNICGKNLDKEVNYSKPIKITINEPDISFMIENIKQEVTQGEIHQQRKKMKQLKKMHKKFVSILAVTGASTGVFLTTSQKANAQELPINPTQSGDILNVEVIQSWGVTIAVVTVALGVALASSLLAVAGIYRMFRKKQEAQVWTTDIIKGLVQVLVSIPIVYSLYHLTQIIFNNLPVSNITY